MEGKTSKISRDRLKSLLDSEKRLRLLEGAGVDNWEGYEYAMEEYEREQEILDSIGDLAEEVLEELSTYIDADLAGPGTGHGFDPEAQNIVEEMFLKWIKDKTTTLQ